MISQPDNIICKHMKKISKIIKRNIEHHQHRLLSTSLHGSNGSGGGGGGGGGSSNMNGGSHRTTGSSANVQEDTDSDEDDLERETLVAKQILHSPDTSIGARYSQYLHGVGSIAIDALSIVPSGATGWKLKWGDATVERNLFGPEMGWLCGNVMKR
ncbi:hypothetical protein ZHAS_00003937 [Anopheles sinensis]|uniref:Uncharacterized protein n=1 Tax=Anopheles sinensis TaxID=74873 RepID=A0A084VFN4_ANOSI|nr:hypothetical protein ZHAS_00003937 [Anopheles sinensis]